MDREGCGDDGPVWPGGILLNGPDTGIIRQGFVRDLHEQIIADYEELPRTVWVPHPEFAKETRGRRNAAEPGNVQPARDKDLFNGRGLVLEPLHPDVNEHEREMNSEVTPSWIDTCQESLPR